MSDEGDDPLPRPKRKIKKAIVSSASSSDSDDSSPTTSTRKKRLRVLSEDGSDSSSGSWAMGAVRRRRALPGLRDSEGDSDSSGWATDQSDAPHTSTDIVASSSVSKSPANKTKTVSGFSSDSSEGNSEKCSICLMKFLNQEVGIPQNCEHIFCLDCITEWSKNMNTCPVDRITFDSIVVRACAGGRVLRTEAVKVAERRPSLEMMIIEDPTVCEVCHNADREESMLLCDGCDLGFHMQCLTPPLTRIPEDQWLCPNCSSVWRSSPIMFSSASQAHSAVGGSSRSARADVGAGPSTSRAPRRRARAASVGGSASAARRTTTRARTTRRGKRRTKRRKVKRRQPRTAARRTHVLASVRAKLAAVRQQGGEAAGPGALSVRRAGAGIPALSLFGSEHQLDYFDEEDERGSEGATAAVAVRPTSSILSAYRQARRKMFRIPSPSHASAAPDLLSDILESQTRLHSRRSVVSVTVDGSVHIQLEPRTKPDSEPAPQKKEDAPLADKKEVDLSKGGEGVRQAPSYPGQGRGWGGGYRYPRDHGNHQQNHNQGNQNYGRGGYDNGYGGPPRAPFGRREEPRGPLLDYGRRHFLAGDEPWHDRNRRQPDQNRGPNNQRNDDRRFGGGPGWRGDRDGPPQRASFGGFENPLDMRVGLEPAAPGPARAFPEPHPDKRPPQPLRPLPQPPAFTFPAAPAPASDDRDRSEDERSDEGLIIDTEKYDPTEPTHDEDSGEEQAPEPAAPASAREPSPPPPPAPPSPPALAMETILAGLDARALAVPAAVLDSAVRAALQEHRALRAAPAGDCPNFSIYSATSVHIASESGASAPAAPPPARRDSLEDLVQEDGGATPPPAPSAPSAPSAPPAPPPEERTLQEYKAKVSKRCPITTNTRNPIKIKLNAPSLIKRQVSLYDDEDVASPEPADELAPPPAPAAPDEPRDRKKVEPDEPEIETKVTADEQHDDAGAPEERDRTEVESRDPRVSEEEATPERPARRADEAEDEELDDGRTEDELEPDDKNGSKSGSEDEASSRSPRSPAPARAAKMTESISETEDERSYTPCLDENKSKDASLEDRGIEGLDTEMISEEEGNDMFSEGSPAAAGAPPPEDGEILDRRAEPDEPKRKRRKDGKKDKGRSRKRGDALFKKGGKAKERNYRERDKEKEKRRSRSSSRRRKDKRKDLERYDVRTLVSERRRRPKDAFGRDVSPAPRSPAASPEPRRARARPEPRPEPEPERRRISPSPPRRRPSASPRRRISPSPPRRRPSPSPRRPRLSPSPPRRRASPSPSPRRAPSAGSVRRSPSPKRRRKRSGSPPKPARRRRSSSRARKRRRSASAAGASPKPAKAKRKKRARSARAGSEARSPRRRSPRRKRARRRSSPTAAAPAWSPPPAPSPRTPPPAEPAPPEERRRRREAERAHRRLTAAGPSKEVFTSGDNILVSVSFKEQARAAGAGRAARRAGRRRRRAAAPDAAAKPVAIIDLERSPFRELTPSPKNVIVLSDDEERAAAPPAPAAPPDPAPPQGPKTPPEPAAPAAPAPACDPPASTPTEAEPRGPLTPPEPPDSPDAYDPYEPTRSASGSPRAAGPAPEPPPHPAPDPAPPSMTLEAAQKTNLSADEVLDRRPLSPIEKVMALLQSTRDVSPEEPHARSPSALGPPGEAGPAGAPGPGGPPAPAGPPAAPAPAAPRVLLPEAPRATPKLFLAKPSPIKSDPIKPMPQATKISRLPLPVVGVRRASPGPAGGASPYSPGSSDFGDLFSPPAPGGDLFSGLQERPRRAKRAGKAGKRSKKSKTVDVKLDDDNLKILDELPSSAVEMQVKSKFLKKLNRQERVVEEVKLVLKPHYNKKHVSKDEYKHILRRAVPKICHNKTGEINPMKIQALVEAYVKKFRKKRKLGQ